MTSIILTLVLATIVVIIALALLGIGWMLTGKPRIVAGACGRAPRQKRDEQCGTPENSCELCRPSESEKGKAEEKDL